MNNFLFRGDDPINSSQLFAYGELVAAMAARAKSEGNTTLPKQFWLVDLCLLNIFEQTDIDVEEDFFAKNPTMGEFVNWPIIGDLLPPYDVPEEIRKYMAGDLADWQFDNLPFTMMALRQMLYTKGNLPVVIYMHCEAGTDRTGETSGSYYIRYLDYSFKKALYIDDHIQNRDIVELSRNAFQWYCYYLYYAEMMTDLNCTLPSN